MLLNVVIPSWIQDAVLISDRSGTVTIVLIARLKFIIPELQEGLEGGFALVGQVVRNTPVKTLREDVVRGQSVYSQAESDLRNVPQVQYVRFMVCRFPVFVSSP